MVSQFRSSHKVPLLSDLNFTFPEGTHAIGRLDLNSEGLLLLTTDKRITTLLFQGPVPHERTYLVQVRFAVSADTLHQLRTGLDLPAAGGGIYHTQPCKVELVTPPSNLFAAPVAVHPNVENSWLLLTLTEGKYHQVRKMVAAVKHRCLRLIRVAIEDLSLENLQPGEVKEIEAADFFRLLKLGN